MMRLLLGWGVPAVLAWQQQGLAIPASICLATEKYRDEEDRIVHFLTERCVVRLEASVKASALYEAYKAWCEENQFGRGMNATLFGNEIGKRFEKKRGNTGMIYQGVRMLTTQEQSGGGVYIPSSSAHDDDRPLEATSQVTKEEGCVGFRQVFPQNAFERQYKGQNREKPYTSSTIVNRYEQASEANAEQKNMDSQPYTNPTLFCQYVETVDGPGYLTGKCKEQDVTFFSEDKRERLRYQIGVVILKDGVERFYLPQNTWDARSEVIQAYEQSGEVQR